MKFGRPSDQTPVPNAPRLSSAALLARRLPRSLVHYDVDISRTRVAGDTQASVTAVAMAALLVLTTFTICLTLLYRRFVRGICQAALRAVNALK